MSNSTQEIRKTLKGELDTMSNMSVVAEDISCNHCKHTIEQALSSYKGVQRVSVDVGSKTVDVDYDDTQVSWEEISSELAEIGYPVS